MGQPDIILDHHREFMERPAAFDELGGALQLVSKVLEPYKSKDDFVFTGIWLNLSLFTVLPKK